MGVICTNLANELGHHLAPFLLVKCPWRTSQSSVMLKDCVTEMRIKSERNGPAVGGIQHAKSMGTIIKHPYS